ncbi:MAG: class I SAM-dependent methyltransferase [Planctomycetes bacterium]|nr:class I SAM-dependent methyltransferase [Planctomycetota bacterium]
MTRLFAALYDPFMRRTERHLAAWRAELLSRVAGRVLEVGAGTGANLPFYPRGLERLVLAEPDPHMRARLAARVARERPEAVVIDAPAEALPVEDGSFDAVVSTLVLCSVADLPRALAEARRVLRPGGALVFLEHVAADDRPRRLRWQRRLEPLWRRVAGNCHLTRRTHEAIAAAGFTLEACERESLRRALPFVRPSVRGVARRS